MQKLSEKQIYCSAKIKKNICIFKCYAANNQQFAEDSINYNEIRSNSCYCLKVLTSPLATMVTRSVSQDDQTCDASNGALSG